MSVVIDPKDESAVLFKYIRAADEGESTFSVGITDAESVATVAVILKKLLANPGVYKEFVSVVKNGNDFKLTREDLKRLESTCKD